MEGLITGILVWAYLLIGLVVVLVATPLIQPTSGSWKSALLIASLGWYGGAPIVWAIWGAAVDWERRAKIQHNLEEYAKLCASDARESIQETRTNVRSIRLVSDRRALYEIFGPTYDSRLFGANKYKPSATVDEAEYVVRLSTSRHVPYVGTYAVYGAEITVVDPRTSRAIAYRSDFTMGDPMYGRPRNCANGSWRDENLAFVNKVLVPPQTANIKPSAK